MNGEWIRNSEQDVAVIFVHGVLSSGETCWRNSNGAYWPDLLKDEITLGHLGIYVYTYATNFFGGTYSLSDVVDDLKERMQLDGLFANKQLIFVCHSMGGIVVRKLLVEREADFARSKIHPCLFLIASPSLGSSYATWLKPLAEFLGHSQALALRFAQDNAWLNDLDKEFQNLKESNRLKLVGKELIEDKFVVVKKLLRKQIVEPISGARYFGERFKVPQSDHFSIAKPASKDAIQHRLLCKFIESVARVSDAHFAVAPTVITLDRAKSTNDEAMRLVAAGQQLPFVIHTWSQTHGRGKVDRVWQGGAGILTASWTYSLAKEETSPEILGVLGVITALAVKDAIREMNTELHTVRVKWPNDVLISNKKVAGILIEIVENEGYYICVIGIGVNVCRSPLLSDRKKYALPPIAIFSDYQDDISREPRILKTISLITKAFELRLGRLTNAQGLAEQRDEWNTADFAWNKRIDLRTPQSDVVIHGINRGINASGQLIVESLAGHRKEYFSGEISSLVGAFDDGMTDEVIQPSFRATIETSEGEIIEEIFSPLVGHLVSIPDTVRVGMPISEDDVLCTIEAMKMHNLVKSPVYGVIISVCCAPGDVISYNQLLFKIAQRKR